MNSFYKSIGLYDNLNFDIEMKKSEFVESLKKITYQTNTSFISLVPDNGIPTRFEYRGTVNENNFTIKRRKHFFDFNIFHSILKGNILEENNRISIKIEFTPFILNFLSFILIPLFFLFIVLQEIEDKHDYFIIGIPIIIAVTQYFALKRNIKRDKYDFERELNFIDQKNNPFKITKN